MDRRETVTHVCLRVCSSLPVNVLLSHSQSCCQVEPNEIHTRNTNKHTHTHIIKHTLINTPLSPTLYCPKTQSRCKYRVADTMNVHIFTVTLRKHYYSKRTHAQPLSLTHRRTLAHKRHTQTDFASHTHTHRQYTHISTHLALRMSQMSGVSVTLQRTGGRGRERKRERGRERMEFEWLFK